MQALDVFGLFEADQTGPKPDDRMDSRHWSFILTDTSVPIFVNTSNATLTIQRETSRTAFVDVWLEGRAVEQGAYRTIAEFTEDSTFTITVEPTSAETHYSPGMVRVTIGKPDNHPLFLEGKNAPVTLKDCIGSVTANLLEGDVSLQDLHGNLLIETHKGNIHAERCVGNGHLTTKHGTISMQFNDGRYTVSSANGVTASDHFGSLNGYTVTGNVAAEILLLNDSCSFNAGSGDLLLSLPQSAGIYLQANAPSGIVRQSLIQNDSLAIQTPHSFKGQVNGGTYTVRANSQSGNVVIKTAGGTVATSK